MILIKDITQSAYFQAKDKSLICELLHPDREDRPLQMGFSLAQATVKAGEQTLPHRLKDSSEIYYILEGVGRIYLGDESSPVKSGQAVYIPPDTQQYIHNTGDSDLKFLCLVSPPWKEEDEELG